MSGKPVHGLSRTPEYRAWQCARHRCTSPQAPAWHRYGGRGIRMCERWLNDPGAFLADMGPKPSPEYELDRIDNDGHYEPGNCRWVPRKVNDRNRRSSRFVTMNGETRTLVEWCELRGLSYAAICKRIYSGTDAVAALSTPVRQKSPNGTGWRALGRSIKRNACCDCGSPTSGARCVPCRNRVNGQRVAA